MANEETIQDRFRSPKTSCVVLLALLLVSCGEIQHHCNGTEMANMKEKGFTVEQISSMCTSVSYKGQEELWKSLSQAMQQNLKEQGQSNMTPTPPAPVPQQPVAAYTCATQWGGGCRLYQPTYAGNQCYCQGPLGNLPGIAR